MESSPVSGHLPCEKITDFNNYVNTRQYNDNEIVNHCFKSSFARSMTSDYGYDVVKSNQKTVHQADGQSFPQIRMFESQTINTQPRASINSSSCDAIRPEENCIMQRGKYDSQTGKQNQDGLQIWSEDLVYNNSEDAKLNQPMEEELITLRLKYRTLLEENQRLQRARTRSPDVTLLQWQTETLQWQFKQMVSRGQMYRDVMEEVCKFLERIHKSLDVMSSKISPTSTKVKARKSARTSQEDISFDKLSQEAFRLLRTVQCLLNTPEPDLSHNVILSSNAMLSDSNGKADNTSVGSCTSLLRNSSGIKHKSFDADSTFSTSCTIGDEFEAVTIKGTNCSKPVLAEDESGFSSMSSFHDCSILPEMKSYPELGVPLVKYDEQKHKRWNSFPKVANGTDNHSVNYFGINKSSRKNICNNTSKSSNDTNNKNNNGNNISKNVINNKINKSHNNDNDVLHVLWV